jgi:hypothetical protein
MFNLPNRKGFDQASLLIQAEFPLPRYVIVATVTCVRDYVVCVLKLCGVIDMMFFWFLENHGCDAY